MSRYPLTAVLVSVVFAVSSCGTLGLATGGDDHDEWVMMMAERHPNIHDLSELETGTRTEAVRSGGTADLSYQSGVTHAQTFTPTDEYSVNDVLGELAAVLEESGYLRKEDFGDDPCFEYEYEIGQKDQVRLRQSAASGTASVTLQLVEGGFCH